MPGEDRFDTPQLNRIVALERSLRATQAELAAELADAQRLDLADLEIGLRTDSWMAWATNGARPECRKRLQVSITAAQFPACLAALASGELSWSHLELLAQVSNPRNLAALSATDVEIMTLARQLRFEEWKLQVQMLARLADEDGPEPPAPREELRCTPAGDGYVLAGQYGQLNGDLLRNALRQMTDAMYRQAVRDRDADPDLPVPSRAELRARALLELVRRGSSCDLDSTAPAKPEAVIVLGPDADGALSAHDLDGHEIPVEDALDLLGDPLVSSVRFDELNNVVELATTRRLASHSLRRALALRDGGCLFPGCDLPHHWTDAHHVVHWIRGGATELTNLASS
jgi:hypothetical protein